MSNPLIGTRSVFTKTVSVLTSVATLLTLSGTAYLAPLAANAAVPSDYGLTEGNTISASGTNDPDVYIVNALGYKRLFLNPVIFSFYGHLGGFANVKSVSAAARDAFPTSGLFRNCETNDQAVWAVEVNGEDTAVLHHVVMSGDTAVAQDPNFFKKVFCINNNEAAWYTKSSVDYTSLSQVPVYSRVPGSSATPTPSYGALSVSLASDNPAAGTLVQGQAIADLLHLQFNGSGVVTNVKLQRLGVSADAELSNVYLYDGTKRLTDAATVSSGVISFNDTSTTGLFTVNGPKTISVRSDISTTTGVTVGVQLTSWNGNSASISGNLFTVANATLATVAMSNLGTPALNATLDPASDTVIWQDTATVGTRYVTLNSLQFRIIGSVLPGDLRNFRLQVDGVQQGSAVAQTDGGYVVFDMSAAPIKLETGARALKLLADIVNGSSRDFTVQLRSTPDIFTVDSQYNQPVLVTGTFPDAAGKQTISTGTLTVTKKTDSPSGDLVKGASGVTLARFELKANGENMKVETLRANVTYKPLGVTGSTPAFTLRNGALFVDGVQVGSTASLCSSGDATCSGYTAAGSTSYTSYSLGSSLVVVPGTSKVLEIRADVYDDDGTNNVAATDIITANVAINDTNVQRVTTGTYGSYPAAATAGNSLTVKTGTLTLGKYSGYSDQSIVSPKNGVKLGHFTMTAASAEDVNMNTITIDAAYVADFAAAKITDMYIKVWNDASSAIYTSPTKATISSAASNSYSVNFTLPKNKTYQVEVWGNVATGATNTAILNMDASGITTGSSTTATGIQVTGQTITVQTGSLTKANSSLPAARLINGGATIKTYSFTLQPAYDDFTLDEVYVDIATGTTASSSGAIASLLLKPIVGGVVGDSIGSATVLPTTGSASFTGLSRALLQSAGTATFEVDVILANVGVGANDSAGNVTVRLDGVKYHNSSGTVTTENGYATGTYGGNANVVVKGYPVFTSAQATTVLGNSAQSFFKTSITAVGAQVAWNDITFSVASTSGTLAIATSSYQIWENGVNITADSTGATASDSYSSTTDRIEFSFATERVIPTTGSYTLELRGTASGALSTGNTVSVQIANPSGTTVTALNSAHQAAAGASFVWTDQSVAAHSTTTDDWFTDGLVKTLAETQSVTK